MKTYHDGANEERKVWLAKLRRSKQTQQVLELIEWGTKRVLRYKKRKGGL